MSRSLLRRTLPLSALAAGLALGQPVLATGTPDAPVTRIAVTMMGKDGGTCVLDHDSAPAGPVTFVVTNRSAPAISEMELLSDNRILGEKENLAPGLPPVRFTVTLDGGSYQVYCPNAAQEKVAFTVTGHLAQRAQGSTADLLREGTKGYAHYVDTMVAALVTSSRALQARIDAGDLEGAQAEYAKARPFYERIEPDVEGFVRPGSDPTDNAGNLDYLIDMRASNLDPAVGWHGFHALERDLFKRGEITDDTKAQAAELVANVAMLAKLAQGLSYRPRGSGERGGFAARRGAKRQDQRRRRAICAYRPCRFCRQYRGRTASLCVSRARPETDRPGPHAADRGSLRGR